MVVTTDQAQFWAHDCFHPPWFLQKISFLQIYNSDLVVSNLLFKF
jgi:hypothetical protein